MTPVKVLIVDDSSTMRQVIKTVLARDPEIDVVGMACDAMEARHAVKTLNPHVMTLDIEMPGMNGIDFLEKVMRLRPMPVIMVSTLTDKGADATMQALEIGAFDCVVKPNGANQNSLMQLPSKIKVAAKARIKSKEQREQSTSARSAHTNYEPDDKIVAIGSSTGGVEALLAVIGSLPANCPPIVVTQHMPPNFTRSLAERLDRTCPPKVVEAAHGMVLQQGHVYIAPGGDKHLEIADGRQKHCVLRSGENVNGHRPSVDVLFASVAKVSGAKAVGVILTGMGNDGAAGLLQMRKAGAKTLGQDERSSVVYGMPKAAFHLGAVEKQLPLEKITDCIVELTQASKAGTHQCHLQNN